MCNLDQMYTKEILQANNVNYCTQQSHIIYMKMKVTFLTQLWDTFMISCSWVKNTISYNLINCSYMFHIYLGILWIMLLFYFPIQFYPHWLFCFKWGKLDRKYMFEKNFQVMIHFSSSKAFKYTSNTKILLLSIIISKYKLLSH